VESTERKLLRGWLVVCAFLGAALCLSRLVEIPERSALRGYDNTFNYLWLRSAMVNHDWDFRNDLELCNTLPPAYRAAALALPRTQTGHIPDKYGIGWSVVTLPFYLVADAIVALGRWFGLWNLQRDGFNPVYQVCIQIGHVALAVAALTLATRTVGDWIGDRVAAAAAVLLVWAASPLVYYQAVDVGMSHGAAFFAVALSAYSLCRARQDPSSGWGPRWWFLAGAGWGLAAVSRFELGVFGLLAAWSWGERALQRRSLVGPVGWFLAGAAPLLLLQGWAWHVVYGRWLVFSYGADGESFRWMAPQVFPSLFSPWHGLYYWHPFLLIATAGLGWWAWERRDVACVLCAAFGAIVYIHAAWWCWWFASSFGNRSCDAGLLPLMAGAGWLWHRAGGRWRALLLGCGLAAGVWNFYIVLLYRVSAISHRDPVSWVQMFEAAGKLSGQLRF
jgi:hypothetical protein